MDKSNLNFNPQYKLIIKDPVIVTNSYVIKQPYEVSDVYTLTDNQIVFKVEKSTSNSANSAEITIINPQKTLRDTFKNLNGRKPYVELFAGWGNNIDKIFSGVVEKTSGKDLGIQQELKLNCSDGALNQRETITKRWYPKGTSLNLIFNDIVDDMQCQKGFIFDFDSPITQAQGNGLQPYTPTFLKTPKSFSGNSNSILKSLGETYGVDTFIEDGVMYILPPNMINNTVLFTKISPNTGLIGSPIPDSNGSTLVNNTTSTNKGLKFDCLLNSGIKVGGVVQLESEEYSGIYKVTSVEHSGSLEGGFWKSKVLCTITDYKLIKTTQGLVLYSPTISPPAFKTTVIPDGVKLTAQNTA